MCEFRDVIGEKINNFSALQTLVLLSLYSAGRDERFFAEPEAFNPYRWQRTNAAESSTGRTPSASLPFAIGARSCIGQKIAQLQMHYLLSMVSRLHMT